MFISSSLGFSPNFFNTSNALKFIHTYTSTNNTRTSTGFDFYGRQLMWLGGDEDAGAGRSFWAAPMLDDSGFYKLFWNSDNEVVNGSVPVAIKKLPPPSLPDSK